MCAHARVRSYTAVCCLRGVASVRFGTTFLCGRDDDDDDDVDVVVVDGDETSGETVVAVVGGGGGGGGGDEGETRWWVQGCESRGGRGRGRGRRGGGQVFRT